METGNLMETMVTLVTKNHQLQQENSRMQKSMFSLFKENFELKSFMQSKDELPDSTAIGKINSTLWTNTCDESQFRSGLKYSKSAPKTSSPTTSFFQHSILNESALNAETKDQVCYVPEDPRRIIGELAYQLDFRILSHVFQGHKRRYGFTVRNIPVKIKEVSVHPVTKRVNEDYERHLNKRYDRLVRTLTKNGYRTQFHPAFSEFIVNTFGVFEKPGSHAMEYNDPKFLKKLIKSEVPVNFQMDMIVILNCLCLLAEKNKMNIFIW